MHAAGVPHTRCTFHATLRHPYTLSHKAAVGKCSINSHQILSRSCAAYTPKQHQAAAPALSSHHADRDAPIHTTVHGNTVHGSIAALHLAWSHTAAVVKQASPWTMETRYRGRKALSSSERGKLAGSAGQGTPSSSVDPAPAIAIGHCNSSNQSARDPGQGMLADRLLAPPTPMLGHTAFAIATQQAQRSSQHEPLSSQHHEAPHRNSATPSQHNQAVSAQDNDTPAPQQAGIPPPPDAVQSVQPIHVLLFAPNVVDYLRLLMLAAACACQQQLWLCAGLLVCSLALDALDGVLARRLGQTSSFGAFLDVLTDIITRGVLWSWALPGVGGLGMVLLEATTFTCTHAGGGKAWKEGCFAAAPAWVRAIMADGFRTPLGGLMVAGLSGLPLWAWMHARFGGVPPLLGSTSTSAAVQVFVSSAAPVAWMVLGAVLLAGRLLAGAVELWVIQRHMRGMLIADAAHASMQHLQRQ